MTTYDKDLLKKELIVSLADEQLVKKIVIFGSFNTSNTPHDMDVAVFCDSSESYLSLALSLRKKIRPLARKIPVDLLPICAPYDADSQFMSIIAKGEVLYEKGH